MQEGSFRVDINISVRKIGDKKLGTRTEIKNMNSFKAIARAIEGEKNRQIKLLEEGKAVVRETRRWDDEKNESLRMRSKEEAQDYCYFTEPDLVPIRISDQWISKARSLLPEFRDEKIIRYQKEYGIPEYDAKLLTASKKMADIFEATTILCKKPKEVSNWLMVEGMRLLNEKEIEPDHMNFSPKNLSKLIMMVDKGKINRTVAKEVFEKVFLEDIDPLEYVECNNLGIISDYDNLRTIVLQVFEENPKSVSDYKNGKTKAMGYLVGQTMKAVKGKADPSLINTIVKELLK